MKKYINGQYIEIKEEEKNNIETSQEEIEPTPEERLEALESALLELAEVLANE